MPDLCARIVRVQARIAAAARRSGRETGDVHLVAVSKTVSAEAVRAAHACGLRDFGENYVQELAKKAEALADLTDLRWHLIGHLQRNKAKAVVRIATRVHTVDSVELVRELGRRRALADLPRLPVLVEVNVGGEGEKSGCDPERVGEVLDAAEQEAALELKGLMTVPPYTDDPEGARPYFLHLLELRDRHGGRERLPELSLGMTHDLEVAVSVGATWVRVGTAIFGERRSP